MFTTNVRNIAIRPMRHVQPMWAVYAFCAGQIYGQVSDDK